MFFGLGKPAAPHRPPSSSASATAKSGEVKKAADGGAPAKRGPAAPVAVKWHAGGDSANRKTQLAEKSVTAVGSLRSMNR